MSSLEPLELGARPGYIVDYVSGIEVKDGPEEREATQIFSQTLVEDYGYPISHLRTRPQFRVKARPSDSKKEYPVDIAVFHSDSHSDDTLYMVVECKKNNRKDGRTQLEDYMRLCRAQLGVWYNGSDSPVFLSKREVNGKVEFDEIPSIPLYGQRLEDIGLFKRQDLRTATNLKSVFRSVRNYLAANAVGITRDEVFAQQIINLIFCKIYDERFTKPEDVVTFRAGVDESPAVVLTRIQGLFEQVKKRYNDVLEVADKIELDARSVQYIVGQLQLYSLTQSDRDAVGEAFETFIGPSLKGSQGQFFTPRNVVQMVIDMVDPKPGEKIIDPACGSGGFLISSLRYLWRQVEKEGAELGWPAAEIDAEKQKVAIEGLRGIDKDSFLSRVAKAYMAILGDGRGGVYCENSLEATSEWQPKTRQGIQMGTFDVVITNPPYGKRLAIDSEELLSRYDLGHSWKADADGVFEKGKVLDKQPPQLLFIERCLDLLKDGGRMGIVLLESTFGMPKYRYVVDYINSRADILAIVTLPEDLFQPFTHAKTCVVILRKTSWPKPHDIFMCDVKWCGHDSRGNPTYKILEDGTQALLDEVPLVAPLYLAGKQ
jgi:type I restriction enzyme M protein